MDPLMVLQRLGSGYLLDELTEALVRTAEEVVETGKGGTVTLTLKVSTPSQGNPMVIVAEQISRSAPKKDAKGAMFFILDGALHKEDIRQPRLDFRTVDHDTGEIRDVVAPERAERTV